MADADIRKRLNYFTGMFLQEGDFKAEQSYHIEQQRQQNKLLFTSGIIEPETGLTVTVSADRARLTVAPGIALDQEGHVLMVLESDSNRTLTAISESRREVFLVMFYQILPTDIVSDGNPSRLFEQPRLELVPVSENPPEDLQIRLARLTTDASGVVGELNMTATVRKTAGVKVAGGVAGLKVGNDVISNPGSTIDLVSNNTITITKGNNNSSSIIIGEGHSSARNNPHNVTAAQVRALSSSGGTVAGNVEIRGNALVRGNNNQLDVQAATDALTGTPGSAFIWNEALQGFGLIAKMTPTNSVANPTVSAAIAGVSTRANVHGVYASAPTNTGTPALFVNGTAQINGRLVPGHTVDTFINASSQRLRTGDVVKLKGTPVVRFRGRENRIPITEVTLADQDSDPLVIGIVDCEAMPELDAPDTRTQPEDPTFIEDGGEVYLVTLGTFAHCKVDATREAIAVGDLLTSSKNPGHAQKATNPKIGTIIGKALEPLTEGTGYIAVFVNIQ